MTNTQITEIFTNSEWFDNSKIKTIRGCKRKAYFHLIGPRNTPLATQVGDGANFGSSVHAAIASYYNNWGKFSERDRRVLAARAFALEWENYFPHEHMQPKHSLTKGLEIIDSYFSQYEDQDSSWQPVEAELGFALAIVPTVQDAIHSDQLTGVTTHETQTLPSPFYYVGRIDGIFRKLSDDTYWLRETKTTSSAVEKRLKQLKFDHQPIGYVSVMRELQPKFNLTGFVGDIVLVSPKSFDFARDVFRVTSNQSISWRRQLIYTVEEWRKLKSRLPDIDPFHQDTERCFDYGKCAFYDLCDFGINSDSLSQFRPDTWNPLLKRTPEKLHLPVVDMLSSNTVKDNNLDGVQEGTSSINSLDGSITLFRSGGGLGSQ